MKEHTCVLVLVLLLIIMISASVTHAALETPEGLSPGDQFHWAFITKGEHQAHYNDIANYNGFVDMEAERDGARTEDLGINWYAVASTETVNAKDNVNISGPVYRVDGVKIADSAYDFWNESLLDNLNKDQWGEGRNHYVWTGSTTGGVKVENYHLGSTNPIRGLQPRSNSQWINCDTYGNTSYFPMYAISEVQTVVPIPAAAWLLGSGIIGLVVVRRRFTR